MMVLRSFVSWPLLLMVLTASAEGQRVLERLDRGLIAVPRTEGGVFLSWRWLGDDPRDVAFHVYRQTGAADAVRLTAQPLAHVTMHVDGDADLAQPNRYFVRAVVEGVEQPPGRVVELPAHPPVRDYLTIPLSLPDGCHANDASVGDLDGDGRYEIVVHVAGRGRDNSQGGLTDPPRLHAYALDGRQLWAIDLGKNIREGAHYTQFLVYDFDLDGVAEVVCKTADGTVDGTGRVLGDPAADWRVLPPPDTNPPPTPDNPQNRGRNGPRVRNDVGKILSGPEFLTLFDGRTGAALDSVPYRPQRAPDNDNPSRDEQNAVWGDNYGNRMDRFLATVAYLDGERPSFVMSRGYYTRSVLAAWDVRDRKLVPRWLFDSDAVSPERGNNPWRGQGNHSISAVDVDADGRDEIVFGAMVIDDDGSGLYSTRLGHGDAQHAGDLDPHRPGLEIWSIHENERPVPEFIGSELRDARTGDLLFVGVRGRDVGRGLAADIDPRYLGSELWGGSNQLWSATGQTIGPAPRSTNMAIWWDGDLLRELLDGVSIAKWDHARGQTVPLFNGRDRGLASNNGSKSNPCLSADILGDWREELIARTADNSELRIYISTIPTEHRLVTLMHDPQYRLGIAWQIVAYNQPPHPGFFVGHDMPAPQLRPIRTVGSQVK
ncbi:MAG: rhamnogalacturonan lyase [Planctomycetaceae bacterium]|nr:rhamnogalacturonan lyase [Planctomycetaceae bacterium]